MLRRCAFLLSPRWLSLYAAVAVATVTMVLLGRWQLHRAHERHGDLQNYSYVLQWWAFSAFVVFMLARVIRDAVRNRNTPKDLNASVVEPTTTEKPLNEVGYRRYVPPTAADADLDPVQRDYNNYLASLHASNPAVTEPTRSAESASTQQQSAQQGHSA